MAGAYVAKPAVVSIPDVPPGWDPDWPRPPDEDPAPYPPGYEPDLSMVMTADDTLSFDGTATVTGSARDNSTYATNEPSAMTWTAAISGTPVNLRFNGDVDYLSSLSSAVSFGTYWGATPSIEFDLDTDNIGDTVILTGYYTLDGIRITSTKSIEIGIYTCQCDGVWDDDSVGDAAIETNANGFVTIGFNAAGGGYFEVNNNSTEFLVGEISGGGRITALDASSGEHTFLLRKSSPVDHLNCTFRTYTDGILNETFTKNITGIFVTSNWLTWNADTGEVTIVNP